MSEIEHNATYGTLYGIGVGPGDPELITVKGVRLLQACRHVFVPKARAAAESVALQIAQRYVSAHNQIHEVVFPMTTDRAALQERWEQSAQTVAAILQQGQDACFLTLGDTMLYSTWIYLVRALRVQLPDVPVVTIPGITAFSAVAAATNFPVGEGRELVTIVPTADDLAATTEALGRGGTVILMKIGHRLPDILALLESRGLIDQAVFAAHIGQANQQIETDLKQLQNNHADKTGYLSTIIVRA